MKKIIVMLLMLAMALNLCACGGEEAAETKAPVVTEAPAVTEEAAAEAPAEEEGGYTVTVVDEAGAPIAGAMVQLCKEACVPGVTDENGVARFNLPEDTYKVSFLMLPEGFTYAGEEQEFYFEDGSMEMTITLKTA